MLLMGKKGIRRGICHALDQYAKANNKYIENYNKIKELSYLTYWEVVEMHINLIKISDEGHFLEVDVQYPEKLHDLHNDLHERMKIQKVEKLVAN